MTDLPSADPLSAIRTELANWIETTCRFNCDAESSCECRPHQQYGVVLALVDAQAERLTAQAARADHHAGQIQRLETQFRDVSVLLAESGAQASPLPEAVRRLVERVAAQAESLRVLRNLVHRIHEWDHMDSAADGPYWRREIEAALAATEPQDPGCA